MRPRDEQRRRGQNVILDGKGKAAPKLPAGAKLSTTGRAWWRTLWRSPLSREFRDIDLPRLVRLAILRDKALAETATASELGEARQLEDRFGLNLAARRRLQLRFLDELRDGDARGPAPRQLRRKSSREHLRAI